MGPDAFGLIGAVLAYVIHGALLWLLVPIGTLVWLVTAQGMGPERVSPGAFLGWLDNNVAFILARGPLRVFLPTAPVKWIPASERSRVTHRIRFGDLL